MAPSIHQILRDIRAGLAEGAAAHEAERVKEIGERILGEIEERLSTPRAAPPTAAEAPIYVVICSRGGGPGGDGPIVLETEMEHATLAAAKTRAARFDGKAKAPQIGGPSRIARLVFEDVDGSPL